MKQYDEERELLLKKLDDPSISGNFLEILKEVAKKYPDGLSDNILSQFGKPVYELDAFLMEEGELIFTCPTCGARNHYHVPPKELSEKGYSIVFCAGCKKMYRAEQGELKLPTIEDFEEIKIIKILP